MTTTRRRPLVELVADDDALQELAPEWDGLLAVSEAPTVFLTWAWVSAWRETLGIGHRLSVAVARDPDDGRPIGIAPFVIEHRPGGLLPSQRVLRMMGSGAAAADHLDLLVHRSAPHVASALWAAVRSAGGWDLIDLDGLRPGSQLGRLLLRRRTDRARHVTETACPVLPLPESWSEYEASLGRNLRQNLRRYGRKLDREAGAPVVERLVVEAGEVARTVDHLAALNRRVRRRGGDAGAFDDPLMVDFHRLAAERFLAAGRLRLHRLDVGGEMIAGISCFRFGEVVSFYTTGFDLEWRRYGPGRRIMASAIRSAIAEDAREFDFLRGDEPYKREWGAIVRFDDRIRMPVTARGRLLETGRKLTRPMRSALRRLL